MWPPCRCATVGTGSSLRWRTTHRTAAPGLDRRAREDAVVAPDRGADARQDLRPGHPLGDQVAVEGRAAFAGRATGGTGSGTRYGGGSGTALAVACRWIRADPTARSPRTPPPRRRRREPEEPASVHREVIASAPAAPSSRGRRVSCWRQLPRRARPPRRRRPHPRREQHRRGDDPDPERDVHAELPREAHADLQAHRDEQQHRGGQHPQPARGRRRRRAAAAAIRAGRAPRARCRPPRAP